MTTTMYAATRLSPGDSTNGNVVESFDVLLAVTLAFSDARSLRR